MTTTPPELSEISSLEILGFDGTPKPFSTTKNNTVILEKYWMRTNSNGIVTYLESQLKIKDYWNLCSHRYYLLPNRWMHITYTSYQILIKSHFVPTTHLTYISKAIRLEFSRKKIQLNSIGNWKFNYSRLDQIQPFQSAYNISNQTIKTH